MYTECVTKHVPRHLPCPVCKNEIEDKSHVLSDAMHMTALEKMRTLKQVLVLSRTFLMLFPVYIKASTSTIQDISNALSHVMAADDAVYYSAFTLSVQCLRHAESSRIK